MAMMTMLGVLWGLISAVLMGLAYLLSRKSYLDREKLSPFECGFDPQGSSRLPFSLRFYLVALIFLIFDVEIVLILPAIFSIQFISISIWFWVLVFFGVILLLGLYYEWKEGALMWK